MFECKYCGKQFDYSYQVAAHTTMCKANPNSRPNRIPRKYVDIKAICPKCGKEFDLHILEKQYLSANYRKFCSASCANGHKHSEETKQKISEGVNVYNILNKRIKIANIKSLNIKEQNDKNKQHNEYLCVCKSCGKEFKSNMILKFCSKECKDKGLKLKCNNCGKNFYNKSFRNYCSSECKRIAIHDKLSEAGKKGIAAQNEIRRSKAEILFCSLCEEYFDKVTHNDPIFNGWDADVLIWDKKIAVLWNGKWHYEKITKKHSVEQVQNRDRIKYKEIEKAGWKVYIIKDLNKFNEQFVKKQFNMFVESLK